MLPAEQRVGRRCRNGRVWTKRRSDGTSTYCSRLYNLIFTTVVTMESYVSFCVL